MQKTSGALQDLPHLIIGKVESEVRNRYHKDRALIGRILPSIFAWLTYPNGKSLQLPDNSERCLIFFKLDRSGE